MILSLFKKTEREKFKSLSNRGLIFNALKQRYDKVAKKMALIEHRFPG
jgi:hypothetical protein